MNIEEALDALDEGLTIEDKDGTLWRRAAGSLVAASPRFRGWWLRAKLREEYGPFEVVLP